MNRIPLKEVLVSGSKKDTRTTPKILLINFEGIVMDKPAGTGLGAAKSVVTPDGMRARLVRAKLDPLVKGVLLNVSSPGGSASASDIIHHELEMFAREKPIVVFTSGLCASAAYHAASTAQHIVASQTALVGSIGVIFQIMKLKGLAEKLGVEPITITAGANKGMTSLFEDITPDQRGMLQELVDEDHEQFVAAVKRGRPNLDPKMFPEITSGQIFSAKQALARGLIDQIGYEEDALEGIGNLADVKKFNLVEYRTKRPLFAELFNIVPGMGTLSATKEIHQFLTEHSGRLLRIWRPGL